MIENLVQEFLDAADAERPNMGEEARQIRKEVYLYCSRRLKIELEIAKPLSTTKTEGYHTRPIARGTFGHVSKIQEELEELIDAVDQGVDTMVHVELSDLYGASRETIS